MSSESLRSVQNLIRAGMSSWATPAAWMAPVEVPTTVSKLTFLPPISALSTPTWNAPLAPPPLNTIARPPAIVQSLRLTFDRAPRNYRIAPGESNRASLPPQPHQRLVQRL